MHRFPLMIPELEARFHTLGSQLSATDSRLRESAAELATLHENRDRLGLQQAQVAQLIELLTADCNHSRTDGARCAECGAES